MLGFDVRDNRLQSVIDPFESGNFKKALQESNKLLKKTPKFMAVKALKALTLVKLGKIGEAIPLAEEVVDACPTDDSTVSVVLCYLRETGQSDRISQYLKNALEKCDNREDLLVCLFLNQVQEADFSAQQKTARLLSQHYSCRLYTYWVIVSTLMQAESDPVLGERMFLPLAEKLLVRDADGCKMETHIELQLLIELLERIQKPAQALDLLKRQDLLNRLDKMDYQVDYTLDRLRLSASLDDWDQVFHIASERLKQHPNEWNCWQCLVETSVKAGKWELCKTRVIQLADLISDMVAKHPLVRGPQLARLDLLANAIRRGWDEFPQSNVVDLLQSYVDNFSAKPICALDVAFLIPSLVPVDKSRIQFLEKIVHHMEEEIISPGNAKQIYRHLCAYQIARANSYLIPVEKSLHAYFAHVPERLTAPVVNSTLDEVDRTSSLDLCPVDGFLLLATSNLMECSGLPHVTSTVRQFAHCLLTAHWIDQLGLVHAPSNHHFRLRLCSLFSLHSLACPELSLLQAERLEVKQLLFVSLGHMIISPGPLLTLWANPPPLGPQTPENISPLLAFHQRLHVLAGTSVSEAEECLVAAYRRRVYTKICEFTKFADRLRHADVFLLARMELVNWQVAVVPDDFDDLIEHLGGATKELELVSTRLENIADCRDFSVSQSFNPPCNNHITKETSFAQSVSWIRLRLLTVSAICQCTHLLMSTVKLSDHLLNDADHQSCTHQLQSDQRALEAMQQLERDEQALSGLAQQTDALPAHTLDDIQELLQNLLLPPELLFITPTQLPKTPVTSLYIHGPYKAVLKAGVQILVGIHRLLIHGTEAFSEADETATLSVLENPFFAFPSLSTGANQIDWSKIPRPSSQEGSDSEATYLTADPHACSPASMLILLGMLYETLTLDCLFVSMVRSVLRPRSHTLLQANKRQRKKVAKAHKSKTSAGTIPQVNGSNDRDDHQTLETGIFKRFDQIGSRLLSVVNKLSQAASHLMEIADAWQHWAHHSATREMLEISAFLCSHLFSDDAIDKYPVIKPTTVTPLITQIAASYEASFRRLHTGLRFKSANLERMLRELQVYECGEKMSELAIQEPNAS